MPILKEIKQINFKGWEISTLYYLEISQDLKGFFPLMDKKTNQVVVCKDRGDLEKIWNTLEKRKVKISDSRWAIDKENKLAVPLESVYGDGANSDDFILVLDNLEELMKERTLGYPEGLLSSEDSDAKFPEE